MKVLNRYAPVWSAPSRAVARAALICGLLASACGGGVPILMYHTVGPGTDPLNVTPAEFDAHLSYLSSAGYQTISLKQLVDNQEGHGDLPENPIVLTFDDGTADGLETVLPLLQKRQQRATFFIVAGFTGLDLAHRHVEQTPRGQRSYLVWPEVKALRDAGMEIGSHSVRHPRLTALAHPELRDEVVVSKQILENGLGQPVEFFAYPYTARGQSTREMVKAAGYRGAVSGLRGSLDARDLQRLVMHRGMSQDDLRGLLSSDWAASYSTGGR